MSTIAFDQFALTRIADFARTLSRLHRRARQAIDDDQIDREFNAVCMSIWGYTTEHATSRTSCSPSKITLSWIRWMKRMRRSSQATSCDLVDDEGMLTDWWGFCWMILAEKRGLLTPENRAAARDVEEKYLTAPNVIRDRQAR